MEAIKTIVDRVATMPELKPKSMCKLTCIFCGDEMEVDTYYRENIYGTPIKTTICSGICYFGNKAKEEKAYFDENIKGLPIKYRAMDCESKHIGDNFGKSVFITGKSGVGKTVIAAGIAKECIKKRMDFKWLNYTTFIMDLQNMFSKDGKENNGYVKQTPFDEAKRIAEYLGVLIIDDLGVNKATEWVRQITYYIINEREQRMLPTIITSNFTLEEIAEQIDVRISSRIIGLCKTIKLSGKDRRLDDKNKDWNILGGGKRR